MMVNGRSVVREEQERSSLGKSKEGKSIRVPVHFPTESDKAEEARDVLGTFWNMMIASLPVRFDIVDGLHDRLHRLVMPF